MIQNQRLSTGNTYLGRCLSRHDGDDRFLETRHPSKYDLAVSRKRRDRPDFGHISAPAQEDGFLVALSLIGEEVKRVRNGRLSQPEFYTADFFQIRNLTEEYSVYLCGPLIFYSST
jgi:hypothetical protein